ncbi:MAG: sporulation protein YqfD [Bacteroides sp.]|nr:sporulation protein YqfD [Eubacterium sp.]MCM1419355.1 sporulation protein YqfD [Roseburia sp.]MCM1463193.1 sporulation protein YqfD [Bacteroides sp.]
MSLKPLGTITFSAIGAYHEEFISELIDRNTYLRNIRTERGVLYAETKRNGYLKIARIARKYGIRVRVTERHGLYFRLRSYRKRIGLLFGGIFAILLLLILECFIWKIEVYGAVGVSENQILEVLIEDGIYPGAFLTSFDVNDTEIHLKQRIPQISWISVSRSGSKISVFVNEDEREETGELSLKTPCNVIAAKTGKIVETQVYAGTLLYPIGSGVSEGNIVVSGIVNDGAEHILMTHADAKIIAEFTENVSLSMPYTTVEKQTTGKVETAHELMLFGFVIPLSKKPESNENKICTEYTRAYYCGGIRLPWKTKSFTFTEYEDLSVTRKTEDLIRLLEKKLDDYCESVFGEYEILAVEKEATNTDTDVTLTAKVTLKGNIAVQKQIWQKNIPNPSD